ncbi:hypothetical protein [Methanoregula sp.]|uniref:hypothetical protein n=1 Tax=Methanoregula sp. TaxID=2052170 RepID=UPI000CBCB832|nr:hypothetical protein [Methanoregula sp.]PKG31337.1 MAG: hypothetical protein CW742_13930 [Methanoregula sp.]
MTIAEQIVSLINQKLAGINTVDIGTVTKVYDNYMRVDVRLKCSVNGTETLLQNVPFMSLRFGDSEIIVLPDVGQPVLVAYTKFERSKQLEGDGVAPVNPRSRFQLSNAVVLGSIHLRSDGIPEDLSAPGDIGIFHKSGSCILFKSDGKIEIRTTQLDINSL